MPNKYTSITNALTKSTQNTLNKQKIELWLANVEKNIDKNHVDGDNFALSLSFLSRFGLSSPTQVLEFLKSPLGKKIEGLITKELKTILLLEEKQYQQMLDAEALHNRRVAFLLLGMTIKERNQTELNQTIQKQIDDLLHKEPSTHTNDHKFLDIYRKQIHTYNEVIKSFESAIEQKQSEQAIINEEISEIQQRLHTMDEQFAVLNQLSNDFSNELIDPIDVQIRMLREQLPRTTTSSLTTNPLEMLINALTQRVATIHEERTLAQDDMEDTSVGRANYILVPRQRIVNYDGIFYLIGINQTFNMLEETEKRDAKLSFERMAPAFRPTQKQIIEERQLATERVTHLNLQLKPIAKQITILTKQMEVVCTNKIIMEEELKKQQPNLQRLKQLQNATPQIANPQVNERIEKVREALTQLRNQPKPSNAQSFTVAFRNAGGDVKTLGQTLNHLMPGQPIPPQTLSFLQKTVNALKTPETKKLQEKVAPSTAPTPFSMTPNPYKK